MKAYKGFNKDMTCRNFQYEEGKTYEHPGTPDTWYYLKDGKITEV